MRRQGFVLGLFSICGQVLLLREIVSSLNGDELFIGTALFGWLLAVAVGALAAGRFSRRISPQLLFCTAALLMPLMIILVRLSPLAATRVVGEIIPFTPAALLSIMAMSPAGLLSGWLFTSIAAPGDNAGDTIVMVYLWEGLGSFVGGLLITVLAGRFFSTLTLAVLMSVVVISLALISFDRRRLIGALAVTLTAAVTVALSAPSLDRYLDAVKFRPYTVVESFDTHYGHQIILARDSSITMVTDNAIEAVWPDRETTENLLLPPLLYQPDARRILYVGRAEFGVAQMADSLPGISIDALDQRGEMNGIIDRILPRSTAVRRIADDPVRYLSRPTALPIYDIIVLNIGDPDSYHVSRYVTQRFLSALRRWLRADGILLVPTHYDTDRYLTPEKSRVLSVIYQTIARMFPQMTIWPGTSTLIMASPERNLELPYDSLVARIGRLPLAAEFIHPDYLADRLEEMKIERLRMAVNESFTINRLEHPLLPHYQALYRSPAASLDRKVLSIMLGHPRWMIGVPVVIAVLFLWCLSGPGRRSRLAMFCYFVAGLVSLSLELISFYIYQCTAGALYSEMAVLIGAFMLGLAVGTYSAHRVGDRPMEYPALGLFLTTLLVFITTFGSVPVGLMLPYYLLFLFVSALATGTLFVGATRRYYPRSLFIDDAAARRGTGYGWELLGSAAGALMTTTLLLPLIGLIWLLWSLVALVALTLAGAILTDRVQTHRQT